MNIVQKIDTGGTSRTKTPMLKFLMNELFAPRDARHITHCAEAASDASKHKVAATTAIERMRRTFMTTTNLLSPAKAGSRKIFSYDPSAKALGYSQIVRYADERRNPTWNLPPMRGALNSANSSRGNCRGRKPTADKCRS